MAKHNIQSIGKTPYQILASAVSGKPQVALICGGSISLLHYLGGSMERLTKPEPCLQADQLVAE